MESPSIITCYMHTVRIQGGDLDQESLPPKCIRHEVERDPPHGQQGGEGGGGGGSVYLRMHIVCRQQGSRGGGTLRGSVCPTRAAIRRGNGGGAEQQRVPTTRG